VATTTNETARSLEHAIAVVRRWWLLIAIGTLVALGLGAAVSIGSGTHFTADTDVVVTQPEQLLKPETEAATQRLADLMNTVGELATSDKVLEAARQAAAPKRSLQTMRSSVTATVVPGTLVITIHTDFPTSSEAQKVGIAVAAQLKVRLSEFAGSGADPRTTLTLEDVRAPIVEKVPATLLRTLLVALVLGFGFSVLAAFALDRG
jgi:capsular polysaccharide biosynthesis protein